MHCKKRIVLLTLHLCMLPSHVVHNHNISFMWPTTQPKMAVMIIFVVFESTVYMVLQLMRQRSLLMLFLLCGNRGKKIRRNKSVRMSERR